MNESIGVHRQPSVFLLQEALSQSRNRCGALQAELDTSQECIIEMGVDAMEARLEIHSLRDDVKEAKGFALLWGVVAATVGVALVVLSVSVYLAGGCG